MECQNQKLELWHKFEVFEAPRLWLLIDKTLHKLRNVDCYASTSCRVEACIVAEDHAKLFWGNEIFTDKSMETKFRMMPTEGLRNTTGLVVRKNSFTKMSFAAYQFFCITRHNVVLHMHAEL